MYKGDQLNMELDVITNHDCKFLSNSRRYVEYLIQWYVKKKSISEHIQCMLCEGRLMTCLVYLTNLLITQTASFRMTGILVRKYRRPAAFSFYITF